MQFPIKLTKSLFIFLSLRKHVEFSFRDLKTWRFCPSRATMHPMKHANGETELEKKNSTIL